ncbi:MAG: AmmeMemoRadiSam system protein B, partial [Bacteroidota bacterium]
MSTKDQAVYATQPQPLRQQVDQLLLHTDPAHIDGALMALIVPDTNLLRGGETAARMFKSLRDRSFDTVILIAPSHTGSFERIHICSVDAYHTPLGAVPVNDRMRNELCDEDDDIFLDDTGHYHVEGVDVQLPYLQALLTDFDVVPIVMGEGSPDLCRELGHAVGEVMYNRRTLIVASANLVAATDEALEQFRTHFEALDVDRLFPLLSGSDLQVDGQGPLLVALIAALHHRANT